MLRIPERLAELHRRIDNAARDAGRSTEEIQLLAVSKTYSADIVEGAVEAGQKLFGENRVQEFQEKSSKLPSDLEWHLIGPLQRNKVRKVVGACFCLQAVDSVKLLRAISRVAEELGVTQKVLLQLRIGGEESKSGFEKESLRSEFDEILSLPALEISGVMTIPPPTKKTSEARIYFAEARELRDELSQRSGLSLSELSMGMSGDFEAAIAEGSTMVRVGSAIFGQR